METAFRWRDLKKRRISGHNLIVAIAQDKGGKVLMTAFQNREAFEKTIETSYLHLYSLSRRALWKKGEKSGNTMKVLRVLVDCDADALLYIVDAAGGACHMGYDTCFYRTISGRIVGKKVFDPKEVYGHHGDKNSRSTSPNSP